MLQLAFEKISGGETGSVFRYTVPAERTPLNTVMETVLFYNKEQTRMNE